MDDAPPGLYDDFDDPDDGTEVVRAKWAMDGATTLGEAAAMLRAMAADLEAREADGWRLTGPIQDDYGFVRRTG